MSLEQLRADLAQISESIPKIDANITNFTASRDAWERDKSNCSGTKSKKDFIFSMKAFGII